VSLAPKLFSDMGISRAIRGLQGLPASLAEKS
jgi:hypothetical protein